MPSITVDFARAISRELGELVDVSTSAYNSSAYNSIDEFKFLNRDKGIWFHPYALYSVGHVPWNLEENRHKHGGVYDRSEDATLFTDSTGFQIIKGTDRFTPSNLDAFHQQITEGLTLQNEVGDVNLILEVPPGSPVEKWGDRTNCRRWSKDILDYVFREGLIREDREYIIALHGKDRREAEAWFNAVMEHMEGVHGLAFGQELRRSLSLQLDVMFNNKGMLEDKRWLHYLGAGSTKAAVVLTTLHRVIRQYVAPNITVTYDATSPFTESYFGTIITGLSYPPNGKVPVSVQRQSIHEFIDDMRAVGKVERFFGAAVASSPFMSPMRPQDFEFKWNEGKKRYDLSDFGYLLVQAHNLSLYTLAQRIAVAMSDGHYITDPPLYLRWRQALEQAMILALTKGCDYLTTAQVKFLDDALGQRN